MFPGNPIPQQCGLRAPRIFSFRGMYGIFVGAVIFVLDASENTEYEGRETVVKITGLGDTSVEVNISQAQKDRLETTSDLMVYVPLEGADIEIPIIANVDYTVSTSWMTWLPCTGNSIPILTG